MDEVKIFVSHNSKYVDIAKSLKLSLQALESKTLLDIKISEEMAGSTDWRQWIEENVRASDIFVLLYPSVDVDMSWCNYELGRFYDAKRKIVCIKNTDIREPPPAFQPYQAYTADESGIRKFIDELFVSGVFTDGKPLNLNVGQLTEKLYERAQSISVELARKFARARVRDQRYERRIVLSVRYDDSKRFDAVASQVEGNADGLNLLGLGQVASVPWSTIRQSIRGAVDWPDELERALPAITAGSLPPALPPFFASGEIYIPVITKAQSVDGLLEEGRTDLCHGERRSAAAFARLVVAEEHARYVGNAGAADSHDVQSTVGNSRAAISGGSVSRLDARALSRVGTLDKC